MSENEKFADHLNNKERLKNSSRLEVNFSIDARTLKTLANSIRT